MRISTPSLQQERSRILDILRGIALLGICLANYPVLSLYIFQGPQAWEQMPTAAVDGPLAFVHFIFWDGKFYTLFSLLFGIGFSIILLRSQQKNRNGLTLFYRRLFILLLIGLAHSLFIWIGDILLLYALVGMLLPLFRNLSDKKLLVWAAVLILSPILIDTLKVVSGNTINLSTPLKNIWLQKEAQAGITDQNFPTWLMVHRSYSEVVQFNMVEFFMRWSDLLNSNRPLKVLGIFLLGLYAGRKMIYAKLEEYLPLLKKIQLYGFLIGLPVSVVYAYFEMMKPMIPHPLGLINTASYAFSVVPLSLAYTATICRWYNRNTHNKFLHLFAAPGQMALTNYLLQSSIAIFIFYGIGLGYGATTGLAYVLLIGVGVYIIQMIYSYYWLQYFNYGPFEWLWRMLTYGKFLKLRKQDHS